MKLHAVSVGEGPAVVLVHGLLLGSLAQWYFTLAPALATSHRAVLYDLRGHGRSPHARSGYDLATLAGDLDQVLLDQRVAGPVALVGHSYGGLVALTWALAHRDRVARVALIDVPRPPADAAELAGATDATPEALLEAPPRRGPRPAPRRRAPRAPAPRAPRPAGPPQHAAGRPLRRARPRRRRARPAPRPRPVPGGHHVALPPGHGAPGPGPPRRHPAGAARRPLPAPGGARRPERRPRRLPGGLSAHRCARTPPARAMVARGGPMAELLVDGVQLHVQRLGPQPTPDAAPTALFVHGLVMDNLASWYFTVANPVATTRPVALYDLRGHGRSARPETGYGIEALVSELVGVLDGLDLPRAVFVGHSFGGLLALAAARAHPERCAGLVLVDGLLPEPGWGERMARTLRLSGAERDEQIATRFSAWLGRHSHRKRNKLVEQARGLVEGTSLLRDLEASPGWPDAAWAAVDAPTLALYGAASDVRSHGERLAAVLPRCTLELVPETTHSLMWEQTAAVRDRVVGWLAGEG
ncbi:MAG: alpha/beta fold hydrolase [Myxococcota bacterium]